MKNCRREFEDVQQILAGAEAVREEMDKAMTAVDWDALSERIAAAAFVPAPARKRAPERTGFWMALTQPRLRPVLAGVLGGLLIGSLVTYALLRRGPAPLPKVEAYAASGEFIDRVELQMAKRETIDYLEKSEYVILDLVQSPLERTTPQTRRRPPTGSRRSCPRNAISTPSSTTGKWPRPGRSAIRSRCCSSNCPKSATPCPPGRRPRSRNSSRTNSFY